MPGKNKIAKVVIPLAVGCWLFGILIAQTQSAVLQAAFVILVAVTIPTVVFYLMADQGWATLARRYRSTEPFRGKWQACPTGQVALVGVDDPAFNQRRLRLVSTLRVGTTREALYLSVALFSKIPLLGGFFPELRIEWEAVTSARTYEAPGWVTPPSQPGSVLQVSYDPNYTGTFVELKVGQPPVFIQLPLSILGEAGSRLRPY